jgi:hypothetical protein
MTSSALLAALVHGWLRGPLVLKVPGIPQLVGLLTGSLILFFGLMGHATSVGILGLSIVLASLLLPTLTVPRRMSWLVLGAGVLMSVPLPESILAAVQGRIGIPNIGKLGFVAATIDIFIGIAFAVWFSEHQRKYLDS